MTTVRVYLTLVLLVVSPAITNASFVTVSLAPVANEIQYRIQNPPVGLQTLGGVPFNIPVSSNNAWNPALGTTIGVRSTKSMELPVNVYGATAVDTLINLGWGVAGSRDVTATFIGTGGANYTLDLETGSDIRNWLDTPYCCNTINGTTTIQVFQGVPANPDYSNSVARIDKQKIALPASFATQTLTKFILTDNGVTGDVTNTIYDNAEAQRSLLYGVTVETVPEPTSIALLLASGTLAIGDGRFTMKRQNRELAASSSRHAANKVSGSWQSGSASSMASK